MKRIIIGFSLLISIFIIGCVPPEGGSPEGGNYGLTAEELAERNSECDLYLNFAGTNYQNRDYDSAIKNYTYIIESGCGERLAKHLYEWLGRAYIEQGKNDSASYIFKQGLKYLPNNNGLLTIAAWNEGIQNHVDKQVDYLEKILSLDETDTKTLKELSDVYRNNEMYEDQLVILNIWLSYDKTNKYATGEKKSAYEALGKDVTQVDKERWEREPSNIQYGLEYAHSLKENGDDEVVANILQELLTYERYNEDILKLLAKTYSDLGNDIKALETYEALSKINKTDISILITISSLLIDQGNLEEAFDWAETAIRNSGGSGEAYHQRGEVYYAVAEDCERDELKFYDKLVYELAYQDYKTSANKGFRKAKKIRDFLKDNGFITDTKDWFLAPSDDSEISPSASGNMCYTWIKAKIKRKS